MSTMNSLYRAVGLGAIGALALAGCGMNGSGDSGKSAEETKACEQKASDKTSLDSAPETTWKKTSGGLDVPTSKDFGPADTDQDKVPSCFQHSPEGALFAAANYSLPVVGQQFELLSHIVEKQAIDNSARDRTAKEIKDEGDAPSASNTSDMFDVVGFSMDDYTKDKATVKILVKVKETKKFGAATFTVEWKDKDWRFDASADTDEIDFAPVSDEKGFTKWGPVEND